MYEPFKEYTEFSGGWEINQITEEGPDRKMIQICFGHANPLPHITLPRELAQLEDRDIFKKSVNILILSYTTMLRNILFCFSI